MKVFVTGASGFVGRSLVKHFAHENIEVLAGVRAIRSDLFPGISQVEMGDLADFVTQNNYSGDSIFVEKKKDSFSFVGVDVVVHTAARAHVTSGNPADEFEQYKKVNCDAALYLAQKAAEEGVKRFIFLSSIGVNGSFTSSPFTEGDLPHPYNAYSRSKHEAEVSLWDFSARVKMEIVIIRPVLIYGPGAPGNFGVLVKYVNKGFPLPLGAAINKKSFLAIDNLVSFIVLCSNREISPMASNQLFLLSDGVDVSTADLLKKVARAYDKKLLLVPIPLFVMTFFMKILGAGMLANRLFSKLQVDSSKARNLLGWSPSVTMEEQLSKMVLLDD